MHDIGDLEGRQIPGVGIASTEFIDAAKMQSRALGMEPKMVFVQHPIQDRTDDELRSLADQALDRILQALTLQGA
jgi:hypothetical protein